VRRSLPWALLLASFIAARFFAAPHARFTDDESFQWSSAVKTSRLEELPVYGMPITASSARQPGALYQYLMAVPQLAGSSPWLGTGFIILLNAIAAWMLFDLGRRLVSPRAGLIALALIALNPWSIFYSDRIWSANLYPVWGTAALYAALRSRDATRWQGVLVFLLGSLPQLHLSAPALWAGCAVILVLRPPERIGWRSVATGAAIAVLLYVPYLGVEIRSDFSNTKMILEQTSGGMDPGYLATIPARVFATAIGFSTSEIEYHLRRGWYYAFDGYGTYATVASWQRWWRVNGAWAPLGAISILVGVAGWGTSVLLVLVQVGHAIARRTRAAIAGGEVLTIGLLVSLGSASALLFSSGKGFFPHYVNFLLPAVVWPVARALDLMCARRWSAAIVAIVVAASMVSMAANTIRCYREVDTLDGLSNMMAAVDRVLDEEGPVSVKFEGLDDKKSWMRIAAHHRRRPLWLLESGGRTQYVVKNAKPFEGTVSKDGMRFGRLVIERRFTPPPADLAFRATERWMEGTAVARYPTGRTVTCTVPPGDFICRYGDEAWYAYGLHPQRYEGRDQWLIYVHPITQGSVTITYPLPSDARRGSFRYALTDGALSSSNRSPVRIRLVRGDLEVVAVEATNDQRRIGSVPFALTATGAGTLAVEAKVELDGQRIMGFDLELFR
jgi:hypothetical protein